MFQNKIVTRKYFFVYLFLISATVFLPNRQLIFSIVIVIVAYEFFRLKKHFGPTFFRFLLVVIILLYLQTLVFERFSLSSTVRLFMNILLPYMLFKIIGLNFIRLYINVIYYLSIISLLFYIPSLISDSFHSFVGTIAPRLGTDIYLFDQNFIIYTWEAKSENILRNSGNFTEPGYFACMLNLALAFNVLHSKKIVNKINVILIISILTTFSTAGYIGLFFIITGKILLISRSKYKYIFIPITLLASYQSYISLEFLQDKVTHQIDVQVEGGSDTGRFGSARLDIQDIIKYPLIGRGLTKATRFDEVDYWVGDEAPRSIINSVTDTILKFGLLGFVYYVFLLVCSIKAYLRYFNLPRRGLYIILGTLFISGFSQPILLTPIFLSLIFIIDLIKPKKDKKKDVKDFYYNT